MQGSTGFQGFQGDQGIQGIPGDVGLQGSPQGTVFTPGCMNCSQVATILFGQIPLNTPYGSGSGYTFTNTDGTIIVTWDENVPEGCTLNFSVIATGVDSFGRRVVINVGDASTPASFTSVNAQTKSPLINIERKRNFVSSS